MKEWQEDILLQILLQKKLWMQVIYHNPSLGLVIKARACKDAGQE
jgi:hypothetical protein